MSITNIFTPVQEESLPVIDNSVLQGGVALTRTVNSGDNLLLGSCCAAKAEFDLLDFDGIFEDLTGKEYCYTRNGEQQGYFTIDTAERQNDAGWKITAYDRMMLFDKTVDDMIVTLEDDFTLSELYAALCSYIGIEAQQQEITNGDFNIKKNFTGTGITGRDMLYWIAEAAASYAFINPQGKVELGFYGTQDPKTVDRSRYFTVTVADHATKPINKVQIHKNANDIGVTVQTDAEEDAPNTYSITDNPLFYTDDGTALEPAAQAVLNKIQGFCYVPFECEMLADGDAVGVGDCIIIKTQNSDQVKTVVMECTSNGARQSLCAVGSAEENNLKSRNRSLSATNLRTNELIRTLESTVSTLSQVVMKDELSSEVEKLSSSITQTAKDAKLQFDAIQTTVDELEQEQDDIKQTVEDGVSRVQTTTVTIDSNGVEVGSSDTEIHTKMTSESFGIFQGNENRISVSPEGTRLQKTIIEDDLTVGVVRMRI